jgi:hypothetical protein
MAINLQTATLDELRAERKRLNDRIRTGGLSPSQLANVQRNLEAVKQQITNLGQSTNIATPIETTIDGYDITSPSVAQPSTVTPEQIGDGSISNPPTQTPINPNDVNNNGIPDNIEAAQLQIDAQARAAAASRNLQLQEAAANKKAAIDVLKDTIKVYFTQSGDDRFVNNIASIIDDYARQGYTAETISVLLPTTEPYKARFSGNTGRLAAGLSALSPAEYLQAENQYNEVLKRFNLGDLAQRDTFSTLISGQVSAAELTDRVVNVYDRIRNADPALRSEIDRVESLSRGQLSDADFAKALLTGETGANELKRKISTAEISAEARQRNLSVARAQELQQLGVTREEARAGFETIAQARPVFEKLTGIYDREQLDPEQSQTELEREVFQGMASERRKRVTQREQATFSGRSGLASSALSSQRAGQI